jgi:hypothetical protein
VAAHAASSRQQKVLARLTDRMTLPSAYYNVGLAVLHWCGALLFAAGDSADDRGFNIAGDGSGGGGRGGTAGEQIGTSALNFDTSRVTPAMGRLEIRCGQLGSLVEKGAFARADAIKCLMDVVEIIESTQHLPSNAATGAKNVW